MLNGKLNSIQYLRALAALTVVVAHAWDHPLPATPWPAAAMGEFGVALFFVISGYIMVAITGEGRFSAAQFLKRRAIRIVPLYWMATTLAALLALILPSLFKTTVFTWPHYVLSLLFVPHPSPGTGSFSPLLALGWTLNYEVWFYICFAALAGFSARGRVVGLTGLFVVLALVGTVWHPESAIVSFYLDYSPLAFCIGCWLGLFSINGKLMALPVRADFGAVAVGALALIATLTVAAGSAQVAFLGFGIFAGALIFLALRFESKLPHWPALVAVGDASYAMYLIHMFVVGAVVAVVARLVPATQTPVLVGTVGLCLALAVAAALLTHYAVEAPILRRLHAVFVPRRRPATA